MNAELLRLCQNENERQTASDLTWRKWLNKWLLHLKEPKSMPLQTITTPKTPRGRRSSNNFSPSSSSSPSDNSMRTRSNTANNPYSKAIIMYDKDETKYDKSPVSDTSSTPIPHDVFESDGDLIRNILHTIDYHDYLILICCRMDAQFLTDKLPQIQSYRKNNNNKGGADDLFISKLLLECILKIIIKNDTIISADDISSHNPLLQQLLLMDIFKANNKIEPLNTAEKKRMNQLIHIPTKEEKIIISWINAFFGETKLYIPNIQYSVSDGVIILKLLDKIKPGCVNWKSVRSSDDIRHKFDKLTNCKIIMDICQDNFQFNLNGMNSTDITDGNLKYLTNFLWQIMQYEATRFISEIQFDGKLVSDKVILQWTNNRIKNYKKFLLNKDKNIISKNKKLKLIIIKSFKDVALNDSILFLNLLSSINKKWINYKLINSIPTNKSNNSSGSSVKQNIDQYQKQRLLNAQYLITIIRKLKCKVFIKPNDICCCNEKAILCIIINIMIIAAKNSGNDQLRD